jgi:hypothetical protein
MLSELGLPTYPASHTYAIKLADSCIFDLIIEIAFGTAGYDIYYYI